MMRLRVLVVFCVMLFAVSAYAQEQKIVYATPQEVHEYITTTKDKFLILDVRTFQEYSEGHLDKAEFFPISSPSFAEAVKKLPKNVTYVVYCRSGRRSQSALRAMEGAGLSVIHLDGGIRAWKATDFPVKQ